MGVPYYLNQKPYTVVRISLFGGHKAIFEQPMLLITNQIITHPDAAKAIYKGYFNMSAIYNLLIISSGTYLAIILE